VSDLLGSAIHLTTITAIHEIIIMSSMTMRICRACELRLPPYLSQRITAHQPARTKATYTSCCQARNETECRKGAGDVFLFVRDARVERR